MSEDRLIKLTGPVRIKPKPLTPQEMTPEQRQWKIQSLKEHIDQLEEALWYAKQDVAQFTLKLDISHATKRKEAERAMEDTEKEIAQLKREMSDLNAV
jgi:hypothetical protein